MNPSLDAKLLAICNVAANVRVAGPYSEDSAYFSSAAFLSVPMALVGGPDAINAALIGAVAEGTVICFRGTLAADDATRRARERLRDWCQDFEAILSPWVEGSGLCHLGFTNALASIGLPLTMIDWIDYDHPVIFCGHSKGGACAQLAALRYWLEFNRPVSCITFGAPRCGDSRFAVAVEHSGVLIRRYENYGDCVPHVPFEPRLAKLLGLAQFPCDYRSAGQVSWIDSAGQVEQPDGLFGELQVEASSAIAVAKTLTLGGFEAVRDAHSIAMGGGYWNGVHGTAERGQAA